MKHFSDLNYYDLLEIKPTAGRDEIRKAYEIMKKTYEEESIATYSLMDPETRKQFMERIEEAFSVLSDESRRREYDNRIGVTTPASQAVGADPAPIRSEAEMPLTDSTVKDQPAASLPDTATPTPARLPAGQAGLVGGQGQTGPAGGGLQQAGNTQGQAGQAAVSTSVSTDGNDLALQEVSGPSLKELRERRGIPLQEIAAKTRINITYLQYIEQDYFKGLPAEVYLRGYLFQYARALGLDPARVADQYIAQYRNWKGFDPSNE